MSDNKASTSKGGGGGTTSGNKQQTDIYDKDMGLDMVDDDDDDEDEEENYDEMMMDDNVSDRSSEVDFDDALPSNLMSNQDNTSMANSNFNMKAAAKMNEIDEEFKYEVLTPDKIVHHMIECIKEVNQVVELPATTTRILLHHFRWDKEKLIERYKPHPNPPPCTLISPFFLDKSKTFFILFK